jgi:enediyne biosynthesis protein E4
LNNDGWPDIIVSHSNSPVAVLRNVVSDHAMAKWVGLRLVGKGNRDVVGSTIIVETEGQTLTRFAKGGGSYLSANDPRIIFGLGTTGSPVRVKVKWSWGNTQTWEGLEAESYWELREGEQSAKKTPSH